jgi:hypothetical protein
MRTQQEKKERKKQRKEKEKKWMNVAVTHRVRAR